MKGSLLIQTLLLIYHVPNERRVGPLRETESRGVMRKDRDGELICGQGEASKERIQVPAD